MNVEEERTDLLLLSLSIDSIAVTDARLDNFVSRFLSIVPRVPFWMATWITTSNSTAMTFGNNKRNSTHSATNYQRLYSMQILLLLRESRWYANVWFVHIP